MLGVSLGLAMAYNKKVQYFFDPLIESMRPVPVIAMIPFFLMWFGIAEVGKLLLITLGVFAIMVVSTVEAVRNVPSIYILAAQTLGASKSQWFRTIIIPAIVPGLIGPLRVAAALSFTLVVAAEFMGAEAGMGYRILEARRLFNTDVILLGVVMIGILSAASDALIRRVTGHITRWSERSSK
jgi:ABC-type nitrate/sulfonate/bicarbonate transport system permease component